MCGKAKEITSCCVFEGLMEDGLKHGPGKLIQDNLELGEISIWEGTWVDGMKEGKGTLTEKTRRTN